MTLRIPAKVLLHVWSYDFYDMTLSTGKRRRHMIMYVLFPKLFVTRETNKEKNKSDPSGTRTQDLSLSIPSTLPTELHSYTS